MNTRRVVITGIGVVSCIGNSKEAVTESLREGKSGIVFKESYRDAGLRSQVAGAIDLDISELIDRKALRFMGDASAYAYLAMKDAIADASLSPEQVSNPRTGLIVGSGGSSPHNQIKAFDILRERGIRRVGAFMVPRTMNSTAPACLATSFGIKGPSFAITSACATSAHCIGEACDKIRYGKQDMIFAGGAEEESWEMCMMFDAMGALSAKYNDAPQTASRPYDRTRDGFVIAGGAGIVVLESLEHAQARGANIYAEVIGYGASCDGADMVQPSGEGALRCMQEALATVEGPIDYINTHGTSTPAGDIVELQSIREIFGDNIPPISSTKSLTGHSLGATGVHEAIYCLLMQQNRFISATANVNELDEGAEGFPIVRERKDDVSLNTIMSNSFGFGGTNATLVLRAFA